MPDLTRYLDAHFYGPSVALGFLAGALFMLGCYLLGRLANRLIGKARR